MKTELKRINKLAAFLLLLLIVTLPSVSMAKPRPTIVHVNAWARFSAETGTADNPYLTITDALNRSRILRIFSENPITIRVNPGVYSAANGESFPLTMVRGVDMEGIRNDLALISQPIIVGGASYALVDTTRYVSVLGASNATISGFVFDARQGVDGESGTSILCDSTSPTIENNIFKGSGHAGITAIGSAHPEILENLFSGNNNWGITLYGESYPNIESNEFHGKSGLDCSAQSYPTVMGNTFSSLDLGISTKGESNPTIINNDIFDIETFGIIVRMDSTPVIQDNNFTNNATAIYIGGGVNQNPDIGGGGRSLGGNVFADNDWDIENHIAREIMARDNQWSSFCCEWIDTLIYDDDESEFSGMVDYSNPDSCVRCMVRVEFRFWY